MCTRKIIGEFTSDEFIQSLLSGLSQSIIDEEVLLLRRGYICFDRFTVIDHHDDERNLGTLPVWATDQALVNIRRAASSQRRWEEEQARSFTSALPWPGSQPAASGEAAAAAAGPVGPASTAQSSGAKSGMRLTARTRRAVRPAAVGRALRWAGWWGQ